MIQLQCPVDKEHAKVSKRELEVLKYIAIGHTSEEIAKALYLSTHTVTTHRKNLISKLGAKNATHLIVKGLQNKIFYLNEFETE